MGQTITANARVGANPEVRLFDLNRSLTGMEIERYRSVAEAESKGGRPPDVLAARLLAAGATSVTVYSNTITLVAPVDRWATLEGEARYLIEHLFEYYGNDAGWSYEARGLDAPPPVDLETPTG
jgi:hypothetical protein